MKRFALLGLGTAATVLLIGGWTGAGGTKDAKLVLPDAEFAKLVAEDAKVLNDALASDKIDKKAARKVQAAALIIAAYSGYTKHPDSKNARENASAAYQFFKDNDLQAAKKAAAALYPKITAPAAQAKGNHKPEFGAYMVVFGSERVGGLGGEKELNDLDEVKGKYTDAQFAKLTDLAYKAAVIGHVADQYPPEKDEDMQTKKNWLAFAGDFRQAALNLASAASSKNEASTRMALEKLTKACTQCHDVFR
jgi:hypothetical protein